MRFQWWLLSLALVTGCSPRLRFATEDEAAATGVTLRVRHINGRTGGEMSLHYIGTAACFITNPNRCAVYLDFYDAQHQPLMPNRKVKQACNPLDTGLVKLAPGDSMRYVLESPRNKYDDQELLRARYFKVIYEGSIVPHRDAKRAQRFTRYTFKATGRIE